MTDAAEWDGFERRRTLIPGREGRREGDVHCPDHAIIQETTKEHRQVVCGKIAAVKADAEKDLGRLQFEVEAKADRKELRGIARFVSALMAIAILVIAGQALWLRSDISDIGNKIQRLNQRVSEGVQDRVHSDIEQTKQLENISGKIEIVNWRLSRLEESQKRQEAK